MRNRLKYLLLLVPIGLAIGLYFYWLAKPLPKKDMAQYVPENAALYIQVDELSSLLTGLINTQAWQKLAPVLGISDQLNYLGSTVDTLAKTGIGPDEAVLLARSQYALFVDGLTAETQSDNSSANKTAPAPALEIVPQLALVIETQADSAKVEKILTSRMSLLARRLYGAEVIVKEQNYQSVVCHYFSAPNNPRQLVAAHKDSVIIIGNNDHSIKACLDVLLHQKPSLSSNVYLQEARTQLLSNGKAEIFAYLSGQTIARSWQFLGLFLSAKQYGADTLELSQKVSEQLIDGLAYSSHFHDGQVLEDYYLLVKPDFAQSLQTAIQPNTENIKTLKPILDLAKEFICLRIQKPAQTLETVVASISARNNVVVSFALRQLLINNGRHYGIDPQNPIGELLGDDLLLIKLADMEQSSFAIVLAVKDKANLLPTVGRYLRPAGGQVRSETYQSVEIIHSTDDADRAGAFIGNYLVLGTSAQIMKLIDGQNSTTKMDKTKLYSTINTYKQAFIISSKMDRLAVAEFMLAVSQLLRTTDGTKSLLNSEQVKEAIESLPPTLTTTQFMDNKLIWQTQSNLGLFSLASLLLNREEELHEYQKPTTEK